MDAKHAKKIIDAGENISVEFKESLNKQVYQTVCSFLNRKGGHIFIGVSDNSKIKGLSGKNPTKIKNNFVTAVNNPQLISPPVYLQAQELEYKGKKFVYIYVPESSQVHRCNGKIFDRNEDGDLNITNNTNPVADLYSRKQSSFSENEIIPYIKIEHLRTDLIARTRQMALNNRPAHPWEALSDFEMLKSAQLYKTDYRNNKEGFTLAAVLLFARDDVLLSVLPQHRTDAVLRIQDINRYDDRDDIRTNLIESYDRLMAFQAKHLPDKFRLENDLRFSLRDRIFREVVSNILIHREYKNPYPAKFIIEKDKVRTENSNRPHGFGEINPLQFTPYPKNPVIAMFFKEIGRADELGSGVRNLHRYCKLYSGADAKLVEEDIFKTFIPLKKEGKYQPETIDDDEIDRRSKKILEFCKTPASREEIQSHIGIKNRDYFRKEILKPLIDKKWIGLTIPDKPNSPNQKYISLRE